MQAIARGIVVAVTIGLFAQALLRGDVSAQQRQGLGPTQAARVLAAIQAADTAELRHVLAFIGEREAGIRDSNPGFALAGALGAFHKELFGAVTVGLSEEFWHQLPRGYGELLTMLTLDPIIEVLETGTPRGVPTAWVKVKYPDPRYAALVHDGSGFGARLLAEAVILLSFDANGYLTSFSRDYRFDSYHEASPSWINMLTLRSGGSYGEGGAVLRYHPSGVTHVVLSVGSFVVPVDAWQKSPFSVTVR